METILNESITQQEQEQEQAQAQAEPVQDQAQAQQDQAQAQAEPVQDQAQAQQDQAQQDQAKQDQAQSVQQDQLINVQIKKKYRAETYDKHDEEYAKQMQRYMIPEAFDKFTDGLMNETHINRFSLLQAIDDYNRTEDAKMYPLELPFQDVAFNFRPYQSCCIS